MIRLTVPSIDDEDVRAVQAALLSGRLVQGPRVAAFEATVADYVGTEYAVAVSNCTSALYLSLLALDVKRGDRIAVPAYSWPATANAVAHCGAEPIFVDIDPVTYNMDPAALARTLARTSVQGIMPVHTFGNLSDMPGLISIATEYGVPLIEDAACALGAEREGKKAGAFGVLGCFSFHPRKSITTGEGGMITTNDRALVRSLRVLRNHGLDPDASEPDFVAPGYNFRVTEIQAALGTSQMRKLPGIIERRRELAHYYNALFRDVGVKCPCELNASRHSYQSYVVLLPRALAEKRDEIIDGMTERGVETTIGTYHIPLTTWYQTCCDYRQGDFPNTDDVFARAITLPLYVGMSAADQESVAAALGAESMEFGAREMRD